MQNPETLVADKKVYYANPSHCTDCKTLLAFEIRSNVRCIFCYNIERERKNNYINKDSYY